MSLPSWPHSRDTLTVWKRHSFCAIQYGDDSDEDSSCADHVAAPQRNGGVDCDECNDTCSDSVAAKKSKRGEAGRVGKASEEDGADGAEEEAESHLSGSEDYGSVEGLPVGMPDVDMYAFVPGEEQMLYEQAAPCVRFLLDVQTES